MLQKITNSFAIFRDDAFPFLGGGNKARKMMALHRKIVDNKYSAIVTTGGVQSNHCRAVALYCKRYNLNCTLVIHGDENRFNNESGNAKIIRQSEANLIFCDPDKISANMDLAIHNYEKNGENPLYLYGGGHSLEGGKIYIDAIQEIVESGFIPDYIFIASGTGTTQAGILTGIMKFELKTEVFGISVGREKEKAIKTIKEFLVNLCDNYKIENRQPNINVEDKYSCNGYEKFNDSIKKISDDSLMNYGFALDTTYTAKAYYGMREIVKQKSLKGIILFWYTGGIYNYLA